MLRLVFLNSFSYATLYRNNSISSQILAGDPEEHIITITGYEDNTHRAKEDIMKIVNELNELIRKEIPIDSRVHSRLIGARGRNIRKIMEDYNVDIKFPRSDDPDPNLVVVTGQEENVVEACDHLLNLEEEYVSTCMR